MVRVLASIVLFLFFNPALYADNYKEYIGKLPATYPDGHQNLSSSTILDQTKEMSTLTRYHLAHTKTKKNNYFWLEKDTRKNYKNDPSKAITKILNVIKVGNSDNNHEYYIYCRMNKELLDNRILALVNKDGRISEEPESGNWIYGVKKAWLVNIETETIDKIPPSQHKKISCELPLI